MRTISVTTSVSRSAGGLFQSVRRLHQCLQELPEVEVRVLACKDAFTEADRQVWNPLPLGLHSVIGPKSFCYAPRLLQSLRAQNPDLVHLHGLWQYPSLAVLQWHRRTHRPCMVSPHGMLDPWALRNSSWKKRLAGWLFQDAQLRSATCLRALCVSEAQSIRAYGLRNPICLLPNGVDLPNDRGQWTGDGGQRAENRCSGESVFQSFGGAADRRVLLFLSRIHPKKGLVNLLKAWAEVQRTEARNQSSEWVLAIAGWDQGGHEAELKRLATDLGLGWRDLRPPTSDLRPLTSALRPPSTAHCSLLFAGPLFGADKEAAYRACDAFILPSYSEGLPMVVLEAWAYGKPVLMTPECNLPEGFAAEAALKIETNPESTAAGLRSLLSASRAELQTIGARGRALVADRFTWPKIAAQMKEVYDWMLGGGAPPPCVRMD